MKSKNLRIKILSPILLIPYLFLAGCINKPDSTLTVSQIKCNGFDNPVGINSTPVFNWLIQSPERGQEQTAYQIIVSSGERLSKKRRGNFWDSGKIISPENAWIKYSGKDLVPGRKYFWSVRCWDKQGLASEWSNAGTFITGLFDKNDWSGAKWIGFEELADSLLLVPGVHGNGDHLGNVALKRAVVPCFRKEFNSDKKIEHAFVFICGLGHYEMYINGSKIGNRFLSPGWTDYRKTCLYNTYDVTDYINTGANVIGTIVGNGFYNINRERYRKLVIAYGAPKMILKLEVVYNDGTSETIISDETWKTSPSPITFSSIYGGEDYDARLEQDGWDKPDFNDRAWNQSILPAEPSGTLKPESDYPLNVMEEISHKRITSLNDTSTIYDFGQNASGIIRIKVRGEKGRKLRFFPGELLGEDSLITQQATGYPYIFSYTLKGDSVEEWTPGFTYYGFRYLLAEGVAASGSDIKGYPVIDEIKMLHTRNSSPEDGTFKCSNELFNSIYKLINWAIKSNFASVVTDCPHREKLGWLEQTHLMGNSIRYIYDIHNLYAKIIDDMMEAQLDNGLVPDIAPEYVPFAGGFRDSPEWGSACVILPWYMYEWYGDVDAVKRAYPMMKRYVSYLSEMAENNILSHGLGDWYDLGPEFPGEAQLTPKKVTATSIYYYDIRLLGKMAELTGQNEDASYYDQLSEKVRLSFNREFLNRKTMVYSTGSQTAFSMPLYFNMTDDSIRNDVVSNLVRSINATDKELTAGDIGYRYLLRVLEQEGHSQLIFDMNSRNDVPGYGFQLAKGATALTESWAALRYVSNNHLMLGHIMEWFFSGIGGIRQSPGSAGYRNIIIAPQIVGNLTHAEATINTIHGKISSSWKVSNDILTMKVCIPAGCKALIEIPQSDPSKINESGQYIIDSKYAINISTAGNKTMCEIPSGEYIFTTPFSNQ